MISAVLLRVQVDKMTDAEFGLKSRNFGLAHFARALGEPYAKSLTGRLLSLQLQLTFISQVETSYKQLFSLSVLCDNSTFVHRYLNYIH